MRVGVRQVLGVEPDRTVTVEAANNGRHVAVRHGDLTTAPDLDRNRFLLKAALKKANKHTRC